MTYFIVNPIAGKGNYKKVIYEIKKFMNNKNLKYKIYLTKKPGYATILTKQAINNADKIVAVGGDGTILEVVNGMAFTKIPLGIIPFGTGNDIARTLGIKKNIKKSLEIIINRNIIDSDLISIKNKYYLNISSIGIDAEIVKESFNFRKYTKKLSYFLSVLKNIIFFKPIKAYIKADDKIYKGKFELIAVANGQFYGGGFKIAPYAKLDSGFINLCIIKEIPRLLMLFLFPTIIFGKHTNFKFVKTIEAKNIKIFLKDMATLNIDGNIYRSGKVLEYKIYPKAIKLISS